VLLWISFLVVVSYGNLFLPQNLKKKMYVKDNCNSFLSNFWLFSSWLQQILQIPQKFLRIVRYKLAIMRLYFSILTFSQLQIYISQFWPFFSHLRVYISLFWLIFFELWDIKELYFPFYFLFYGGNKLPCIHTFMATFIIFVLSVSSNIFCNFN